MQAKITGFSDLKTNEYGPSAKIKLSDGDQLYINEDPTNLVGKTVDIDVNEKTSQKTGKRYKIGKIIKVYEATATTANGNSNGKDDTWNNNSGKKVPWDAYRAMAEAAHGLAVKLEPDHVSAVPSPDGIGEATVQLDRSIARAAILNTVMIAYSNGKIFVPEDDDMPPW